MRSVTEAAVQKANKQLLEAIRKLPQQPLVVVGILAAFGFLGTFFLMSSRAAAPGAQTVYFELQVSAETKPFIVALNDPAKIEAARSLAAAPTTISGTVVKQKSAYNNNWSYFLDPATIEFGNAVNPSCNVAPQYLEENLRDAGVSYLPGNYWCPSEVRGLREVSR